MKLLLEGLRKMEMKPDWVALGMIMQWVGFKCDNNTLHWCNTKLGQSLKVTRVYQKVR